MNKNIQGDFQICINIPFKRSKSLSILDPFGTKKENKALPLKNREQSWFVLLRSLFCFSLGLWNQSALICETWQNIWNITKIDKNTFLEFICCLEFSLMLLKGFKQKRIRVCAVLKGGKLDLQSPTKGHKNQKNKFLSL